MARILITGSSDGLGSLAAQALVKRGHQVVLHARSSKRAEDATNSCPGAEGVVVGDLSSMSETKQLAQDINNLGAFDTVIHNAGLFTGPYRKTSDGFSSLVAVNILAPYILTCSISPRPKRITFLSSSLHNGADGSLQDVLWMKRGEKDWNDFQAYSDSKLYNIMFAKAFAARFAGVACNSMDPGWVPTKMGGSRATGDLDLAVQTYVMLAEGEGKGSGTGKYFRPGKREDSPKKEADSSELQDKLLRACAEVTGIAIPET